MDLLSFWYQQRIIALDHQVDRLQSELHRSQQNFVQVNILRDQLNISQQNFAVLNEGLTEHEINLRVERELNTWLQHLLDISEQNLTVSNQELTTLQNENIQLLEEINTLKQQLRKTTIPKARKPFQNLSSRAKRTRKLAIKTSLKEIYKNVVSGEESINTTFQGTGYQFSVTVRGNNEDSDADIATAEASRLKMAQKIIRVKDKYRLPYKALQALRVQGGLTDIPPERILQAESLRLATCLPITPMTRIASNDGCSRTISDVLEFLLDLPEHRHRLQTNDNNIKITLRFACDGARITKNKNSVRGVCKLIHPPGTYYSNKDSPDDEITLFVYMGEEKRQALENASTTTFQQMRDAAETGVNIKGKNVKVEWLFCSDWKAMQIVKGVNAANSNYFCLWCLCTKENITNFNRTWGVERNAMQQRECLTKTTQDGRCGYQHPDLLSWIPYSNVIPDELHVRLRITSKLLNQVVVWAICQDKTTALVDEMRRIKVDFRMCEEVGDDGKGCIKKWTQLAGNELNKVLKNLRVISILEKGPRDVRNLEKLPKVYLQKMLEQRTGEKYPRNTQKEFLVQELRHWSSAEEQRQLITNCPPSKSRIAEDGATPQSALPQGSNTQVLDPTEIQMVWQEFDRLMESIKAPKDSENFLSPEQFHEAAKSWALKYRKETFFEDVIPYIHALVYHVPDAMKRHGYLPHAGIAQVERKNYDQRLAYFQGTSKEGGRARKKVTVQILERENRQLYHRRFPQGEEPAQVEEMGDGIGEDRDVLALFADTDNSSNSEGE